MPPYLLSGIPPGAQELTNMNWYYINGNERRGPVDEAEFQRLMQQNVVGTETLVWRDGMADWQPWRVAAGGGGVGLAGAPAAGAVVCAACGRSVSPAESFTLSGKVYCGVCKPVVLQRINEGQALPVGQAEEVRLANIKHETSVKSIGLLYYLGGTLLTIVGLTQIAAAVNGKSISDPAVAGKVFGIALFMFVIAAAQFVLGSAVRRLRPWSRIGVGILSGIGLFGFPVGTVINAYILYLVFSKRGAALFTPEYHEIIAQTPHVRYRTSVIVWIALGLLLFVIFAAVFAAVVLPLLQKH